MSGEEWTLILQIPQKIPFKGREDSAQEDILTGTDMETILKLQISQKVLWESHEDSSLEQDIMIGPDMLKK